MAGDTPAKSPGDQCIPDSPPMTTPRLELIYRLSCEMSPTNQEVGAPFSGTQSRMIMPIVGGIVKGPSISGVIENRSGADWGTRIQGTNFMQLDARYTLKTDDGFYIYVKSKGIFAPHYESLLANGPPTQMMQDDTDWFTRLQFEVGPGPYNWMNGIFGIGVLVMQEGKIYIDAYRLTNRLGAPARDFTAKI